MHYTCLKKSMTEPNVNRQLISNISSLLKCRMQVEVSKYTEGINDKALRPNGLPKSLIRYDGKKECILILVFYCIKFESFHIYSFFYHFMSTVSFYMYICHSARQMDKALGSITEVVQTVKHPKSHIQAMSQDTSENLDYVLPKSADFDAISSGTPSNQTPQLNSTNDVSQEADNKTRKSSRISLMGSVSLPFCQQISRYFHCTLS